MMNELNNITVSTRELAEIFNVSEKYINDLVLDYQMPKLKTNKYPLIECVKFRLNHLAKIHAVQISKYNNSANRERIEAANAKLKELELGEKEKLLASVEEFGWAFANWFKIFKKAFESIEIFAKHNLYLNDEQVSELNKYINRILNQLSEIPVEMRAKYIKLDQGYNEEMNLD